MNQPPIERPHFLSMTGCEIAFDRNHQLVTLRPRFSAGGTEREGICLSLLEPRQAFDLIASLQQALANANSQPRSLN
jgi:hypothetical protein